MTTTQRTLTVNDILEALYRVPPHTPVIIKASIYIPDTSDGERASWSGPLAITNVRTCISGVELEARA